MLQYLTTRDVGKGRRAGRLAAAVLFVAFRSAKGRVRSRSERRHWQSSFASLAALACLAAGSVHAATPPLVELKAEGKTYRGRVAALGDSDCFLLARDGRLNRLAVDKIESHQQVSPRFRGFTAAEMRDELRREFGAGYEVSATEHYLVCAEKGRGERFAPLFEEVYRTFHGFFSVRGFTMKAPEFPLAAVIYPSRAKFAEQCREDHVQYVSGLMGYYLPASNRVCLFDPGDATTGAATPPGPADLFHPARPPASAFFEPQHSAPQPAAKMGNGSDVRSTLRDTIIHETTHQAAFNTGLHSRIGETPRWVVEGLATVFEAPGIREGSAKSAPASQRINRERYLRFGNFAKSRRQAKSLREFVSSDDMLHRSTLDFYSEAWALTFYLVETRASAYNRYLKTTAEREPLQPYAAKDRLTDFETAFGGTIDLLEADFLRYMERLKVD